MDFSAPTRLAFMSMSEGTLEGYPRPGLPDQRSPASCLMRSRVPAKLRAARSGRIRCWKPAKSSALSPTAQKRCTCCAPRRAFIAIGDETDGTVTPLDLGTELGGLQEEGRTTWANGLT